jgi:hypothetical protein
MLFVTGSATCSYPGCGAASLPFSPVAHQIYPISVGGWSAIGIWCSGKKEVDCGAASLSFSPSAHQIYPVSVGGWSTIGIWCSGNVADITLFARLVSLTLSSVISIQYCSSCNKVFFGFWKYFSRHHLAMLFLDLFNIRSDSYGKEFQIKLSEMNNRIAR